MQSYHSIINFTNNNQKINNNNSSSTSAGRVASIIDRRCRAGGVWAMAMAMAMGVRGRGQKSLGSAGAEGLSIRTPNLHQEIQYALPKRTPARRFVGPC
jgi:hypothetical protein